MAAVLFDLDETLIDRNAAVLAFAQAIHRGYCSSGYTESQLVDQVVNLDAYGYNPRE